MSGASKWANSRFGRAGIAKSPNPNDAYWPLPDECVLASDQPRGYSKNRISPVDDASRAAYVNRRWAEIKKHGKLS